MIPKVQRCALKWVYCFIIEPSLLEKQFHWSAIITWCTWSPMVCITYIIPYCMKLPIVGLASGEWVFSSTWQKSISFWWLNMKDQKGGKKVAPFAKAFAVWLGKSVFLRQGANQQCGSWSFQVPILPFSQAWCTLAYFLFPFLFFFSYILSAPGS